MHYYGTSAIVYHELREGLYGVRSSVPLQDGERITVMKTNGEARVETVDRVVSSADGVWLATIRRRRRVRSR